MRLFFLLGLLCSLQASAPSLQCQPIEKDLAWVETNAHPRGTEVFIHLPVKHAELDLGGVSISYGEQITFELPLWPGEQADEFGVIYLQKSAGRFSVLASYGAGACKHQMKQDFNIGAGDAQPTVQRDGPASGVPAR
jgi:hypothetical protein